MKKSPKHRDVFYYSRCKLALYLFLNLILLALALFFTWLVFPEHAIVYYFSITACVLAVLTAAAVLIINHPLAVLTSASIKIDLCQPLKWKDIKAAKKTKAGYNRWKRDIIILEVKDISKYRLNFVQRLIKNSEYSAFSIPLYAMNIDDAQAIEAKILKYVKQIT